MLEGLRDGHAYPRWVSDANRGFGSPALIHRPPLSAYSAAIFALPLGDLMWGLRISIVLSSILAGFAFYYAARSIAAPWPAAVGAALYTLFPYHSIDLYERFALSEYHAFIFVPLVFRFAHDLFEEDVGARSRALLGFIVSYAALLLAHVLVAYMALFLLAPYALLRGLPRPRAGPFVGLAVGGTVAVGLAAVYLAPLFVERSLTHAEFLVEAPLLSIERNFALLDETARGFGRSRVKPYVNWALVYQGTLALVALCVLPRKWNLGWTYALLAGFATLLQTVWSLPLYRLVPEMELIGFPWRFQLFQSFFTIMLAVWVIREPPHWTLWMALALPTALALQHSVTTMASRPYMLDARSFEREGVAGWVQREHIPKGVPQWRRFANPDYAVWDGRVVGPTEQFEFEEVEWRAQHRVIRVDAEAPVRIAIRTFMYPGWVATLDGQPTPIVPEARFGAISVMVPTGQHELRLEFVPTPARVWGARISWVTALGLVGVTAWLGWRGRGLDPSLQM
jgi:hypothetical protein